MKTLSMRVSHYHLIVGLFTLFGQYFHGLGERSWQIRIKCSRFGCPIVGDGNGVADGERLIGHLNDASVVVQVFGVVRFEDDQGVLIRTADGVFDVRERFKERTKSGIDERIRTHFSGEVLMIRHVIARKVVSDQ
jgi:hypothetical protein